MQTTNSTDYSPGADNMEECGEESLYCSKLYFGN